MKSIKLFQIDAFTNTLFTGNPAAVCLLDNWLADDLLQSIAAENNLAETAFVVPSGKDYEIRWFTPSIEVDLCGHATLASAFVLFNLLSYPESLIRFHSPRSGLLTVKKNADMFYLDFPTDTLELISGQQNLFEACIGIKPIEVYKGKTDYIAIVDNESSIKSLQPNLTEIAKLKARGLIVTAKGDSVDFVSRFFAPQSGINEDPVTGSAHTSLLPIWAKKLGKTRFVANQLSARGGQLICEYNEDRCLIGGKAKLYLREKLTRVVMKILAIETETEGVEWDNSADLLKDEAQHVYHLYLSDSLREIYFTENKNAVLVLETADKKAANKLLGTLPLVKAGKIIFEVMELKPYTGYERIMRS